MNYIICFFIIFFLTSCTTIQSDRPYIPSPNNTKQEYSSLKLTEVKKHQKGALLILIQSKRGINNYTPEIEQNLKKLEEKKYFEKIVIKNVNFLDLKTINKESVAKGEFKYILCISYYSNNSVSLSKFHAFMKTATLNLYDLLPIFSPLINSFVLNYSFTLEASLMDAKTLYVIDNYRVSEHFKKGIKGGGDSKNLDIIYEKPIIDKVSKKLLEVI